MMNKLLRKVNSVKYLNTSFPENYESTEKSYKYIRLTLAELRANVLFMQTYEYGGPKVTSFINAANSVSEKINVRKYMKSSIFDCIKEMSDSVKSNASHENLINSADQSAKNFEGVSEAKKKMNDKLEKIIEGIDETKAKTKKIDELREKVRETRYNLEKAIQVNKEEEKIEQLKEKFNLETKEALGKMKDIIFDGGFDSSMTEFSRILKEFYENAGNSIIL